MEFLLWMRLLPSTDFVQPVLLLTCCSVSQRGLSGNRLVNKASVVLRCVDIPNQERGAS